MSAQRDATRPGEAGDVIESQPEADNEQARGHTYIADSVVSLIARIAAEQVDGIHQIGESTLRGLISRMGRSPGVASEVGLKEAAVDVDVIVEYGFPIKEVADELRRHVIESVEFMTGRQVVEVNIHVMDIHVPKPEKQTRRRLD